MRNYKGELAECTQSNLFIVKDGAALTPPLDAGLLPGITREFLFEIGATAGIPVREAVLKDEDLLGRRRSVSDQHHARARPDRAGRRSDDRQRNTGTDHAGAARSLPPRRRRAEHQAGFHAGVAQAFPVRSA